MTRNTLYLPKVTDKMMLNTEHIFPHNMPTTKEAYYYLMIFERFFPPSQTHNSRWSKRCMQHRLQPLHGMLLGWKTLTHHSLGRAAIGVCNSAYEKHLARRNLSSKIIDNVTVMNGASAPELIIRS